MDTINDSRGLIGGREMNTQDKWRAMAWEMTGIDDPRQLGEKYETATGAERIVISFLLNVWAGTDMSFWEEEYDVKPTFNFAELAARLDTKNRHAIAKWIAEPFWP